MSVKPISLLELNQQVRSLVKEAGLNYWITAEISELKVNYSGHCYLELIQKDKVKDVVVARMRAVIWATTFRMVKPYFETTTGQSLAEGMSIMVRINVDFHEVYGLSLTILDIEPTYTVGELALRKQKIIEKLIAEGVLDMNKETELPYLCQRIAVVSSSTAAGFEDFADQLLQNDAGYKFYLKLFPAVMQGEAAESSIIEALDKIYTHEQYFDAVVIIRGGGSQADLNCFNSYWLAYHITQFPIPVLTGIGHEQDDSVVDMVAHTRLKTPTAVATFLIDRILAVEADLIEVESEFALRVKEILEFSNSELHKKVRVFQKITLSKMNRFMQTLIQAEHQFLPRVQQYLFRKKRRIDLLHSEIRQVSRKKIEQPIHRLDLSQKIFQKTIQHFFDNSMKQLEHLDERIRDRDPMHLLKRGYSITRHKGKVVTQTEQINKGEILETQIYQGKIKSTVTDKTNGS